MRCILLVVAAGLLLFAGSSVLLQPEKKDDAPNVQRSVECRWVKGRIDIDGRTDEKAWDEAVEIKDFVVFWEKRKAKTATRARLLWDDRYLYFTASMEDSDLYASVKEKNGETWYDDV